MSKAALSVFVFGIYLILLGIILMVIPNVLLTIFGIPTTTEVWVRVVGMLVLLLGYYYTRASRNEKEMISFFRWTVHARSSVIIFFIIFVALGFVTPLLILFGVVDLVAAIWTWKALHIQDSYQNVLSRTEVSHDSQASVLGPNLISLIITLVAFDFNAFSLFFCS